MWTDDRLITGGKTKKRSLMDIPSIFSGTYCAVLIENAKSLSQIIEDNQLRQKKHPLITAIRFHKANKTSSPPTSIVRHTTHAHITKIIFSEIN
jgi:hypothetical protein